MSRLVLDNTVAMAWCFTDEATPYTENILSRLSNLTDTAVVPALWLYEVVNVVTLAARKGRISKTKATQFLGSLADLPIEVQPLPSRKEAFAMLPPLIEQHRLTAYDAAYLEIALRQHLPMATLDGDLIEACKAAGAVVL